MSGYRRIDEHLIRACLAPRVQDSHKGTYGHLLALVGSYGMAGAARFCVEGAYRCGVGLVTAAVPTVSASVPQNPWRKWRASWKAAMPLPRP